VRKTTKLIEGGHRGLQDYRHMCYYFYVFTFFYIFFENPQNSSLFTFFAVFRTFSRTMLACGKCRRIVRKYSICPMQTKAH